LTTAEERAILDAIAAAQDNRSREEKQIDAIVAGKVPEFSDDPKLYDYPPKLSDEAKREVELWAKRAEGKR
jgi:hypothetical protein